MPTLQIHGHRVEVARQGRGEPVILLHASGSSGAQWRGFAERLGDRFLTLAPDHHGHGGTAPWPGYGAFTLGDDAALVMGLIDGLPGPVHLVGHSYGAAVALQVARKRPDALRSLALIEPAAFHLLRDGNAAEATALAELLEVGRGVLRSLGNGDHHGGFGHFVDYWNGPGAWAAMPIERRSMLAANLPNLALAFHAVSEDPSRVDDFADLAVPTLVLQGSRTTLPARRICERLARALPFAVLQVIPGAGHMSPLTHAAQVNDLLAAHLDANSSAHAGPAESFA